MIRNTFGGFVGQIGQSLQFAVKYYGDKNKEEKEA